MIPFNPAVAAEVRALIQGADDSAFDSISRELCQVAILFSEWCQIRDHPAMADSVYSHYIVQLQQNGLLKGDDVTDRFFFSLTHLADLGPNKGSLLPKILSMTAKIIQKDAEEKKASFNPRPYFRLFINWLSELTTSDLHHDSSNVLTAFANTFHVLQPLRVPAWSFVWLELVSHRCFMPKLLMCNLQKGWPFFQRLLVDLFKFIEPYLRNAELGQPIHLLYKGTLRVLLVLLHDFPEFLYDYHFSFCDVIPASCIQMRNVILCAFPRNMRLPDPSTRNLKIDLLPEISIASRIMTDVDSALKAKQMKAQVDEYLKRPEGSLFLTDLKQKLLLPQNEANVAGTRYNVSLVNSLVLYIGMKIETTTEMFRKPCDDCRHRREIVQEQITRVLLERLIVNRPHPWGLLNTFIELIKNPSYSFWGRSFIRCAPEIEKLFESVARSCGGKAADDGIGLPDGGH
ncbi:hypothetical protein ACP70R_020883 [Stipagrostis hirtigluma subsp. patula]